MTTRHLRSTPDTITWGRLPSRLDKPVLEIASGTVVSIDALSHEGIVEDQGRDPVAFFGRHGVSPEDVLPDAVAIAASEKKHDFDADGPHIITGPVRVEGAMPGDVLKVELLSFTPSVHYGVIANRHGKGALPGEFPEGTTRHADASAARPERYGNVSVFVPIERDGHGWRGTIDLNGRAIRFPATPFLGTLGVTPDREENWNSIPPYRIGGNIDVKELTAGATLYLPVEVEGAGFFVGDPHFAQGDGEVALSALEGSLRAVMRLSVVAKNSPAVPAVLAADAQAPFAETERHWVCMGLHADLDEAMKSAVRQAVGFLSRQLGIPRHLALAYLSAGADFEVSQVVDRTKGVHALIAKADFADLIACRVDAAAGSLAAVFIDGACYLPAEELCRLLSRDCAVDGEFISIDSPAGLAELRLDSCRCRVGGEAVRLSGSPTLVDGAPFLPAAALPIVLGAIVNWSTEGREIVGTVTPLADEG